LGNANQFYDRKEYETAKGRSLYALSITQETAVGKLFIWYRNSDIWLFLVLVYCIDYISLNDLPEFPSAALSSVNDATASPPSSALQAENSFYVI